MSDVGPETTSTDARGELGLEEMSQFTQWTLLKGNRQYVAGLILLVSVVFLGVMLTVDILSVRDEAALTRLFSGFVGGNLTLLTVVITINQLIISREFGSPDEINTRIREIMEFRHEVEQTADAKVSPVTLDRFLDFLIKEIHSHAIILKERIADVPDPDRDDDLHTFADLLITEADEVSTKLEAGERESFHIVYSILDADFTDDLYRAEQLRTRHADSLSNPVNEKLTALISLIEHIGVARQHFKTVYIQRELADLSRKILYMGVPAIVLSVFTVWLYGHPDGVTIEAQLLEVVVVFTTAVALGPLALLVAYVLRITTVTRQTASLLPFKVQEQGPL